MAEQVGDQESRTEVQEAPPSGRPWLRDLASIVTLLSVVAGVWVSVLNLRQKAESDERTANVQLDSAKIQLEIAKEQGEQKKEDNQIDLDKHKSDLAQQKLLAETSASERHEERLNGLLAHLFASQSASEGDLAMLLTYVDADKTDGLIVENAVRARLDNPRSKEEVSLGLSILEKMGPRIVATVVAINQSARDRFDHILWDRFIGSMLRPSRDVSTGKIEYVDFGEDSAAIEALKGLNLDRAYAAAVLSRDRERQSEPTGDLDDRTKAEKLLPQQQIAEYTIKETSHLLLTWLPDATKKSDEVDFSGVYLETAPHSSHREFVINLEGAYVTHCESIRTTRAKPSSAVEGDKTPNGFEGILSSRFVPCR